MHNRTVIPLQPCYLWYSALVICFPRRSKLILITLSLRVHYPSLARLYENRDTEIFESWAYDWKLARECYSQEPQRPPVHALLLFLYFFRFCFEMNVWWNIYVPENIAVKVWRCNINSEAAVLNGWLTCASPLCSQARSWQQLGNSLLRPGEA